MNEQERLMALMQNKDLNAKEFAAEVGISAATMSNVINGRNKPSLEVMQKVLNRFRTVSSDWLILGIGQMYYQKTDSQSDIQTEDETPEMKQNHVESEDVHLNNNALVRARAKDPATYPVANMPANGNKEITKVVVFYTDGTYEELIK